MTDLLGILGYVLVAAWIICNVIEILRRKK